MIRYLLDSQPGCLGKMLWNKKSRHALLKAEICCILSDCTIAHPTYFHLLPTASVFFLINFLHSFPLYSWVWFLSHFQYLYWCWHFGSDFIDVGDFPEESWTDRNKEYGRNWRQNTIRRHGFPSTNFNYFNPASLSSWDIFAMVFPSLHLKRPRQHGCF